jgi:hypothetical protein
VKEFGFIGPSYESRSPNYSVQRTVNFYLEAGKGKSPGLLIGTPGLTAPWLTLTGNGIRGMYVVDDSNAVVVCGGTVYKVTSAGVSSSLGSVPDDSRPVQIANNGTRLFIATAGNLYSVTMTGSASTFVKSGIGSVDTIGTFFVATKNTNSEFIYFFTADGTTWDPLNVKTTNSSDDILVGCKVARRTIYFFGTKSIEPWYDTGATDIPFSRIEGGVYEVGTIAKDSIAEMDSIFWLGGDEKGAGTVWMAGGGPPKRISTPAIEFAISQWPNMSDAEAFTYSQEGHSFYVLSSQSANETWVYDISTGEWHERAWLNTDGELHRIRPRCHIYFAGKNLVGDWQTGDIYEYDLDTYSDNGNPLPAIRTCGTLQNGMEYGYWCWVVYRAGLRPAGNASLV